MQYVASTITHTHTLTQRVEAVHTSSPDPSIFSSSLAQCAIYLNCCHFSSLRSTAIQPPLSTETLQNHNVMHVGQKLLNTTVLAAHKLVEFSVLSAAPPDRPGRLTKHTGPADAGQNKLLALRSTTILLLAAQPFHFSLE